MRTHQVGQGDHHEGVSWPDVQIIRLHGELRTKESEEIDVGAQRLRGLHYRHLDPFKEGTSTRRTDLSVNGWHGELHVAVGDVGLAVVEAAAAEELLADGRERSVTAHNQVRVDLLFGAI